MKRRDMLKLTGAAVAGSSVFGLEAFASETSSNRGEGTKEKKQWMVLSIFLIQTFTVSVPEYNWTAGVARLMEGWQHIWTLNTLGDNKIN